MSTILQYSGLIDPIPKGLRGCKDFELVRYVGRFGAVSIGHVMAEFGIGQSVAYRRIDRCVEAGLIERLPILRTEPTALRATRGGLRFARLEMKVAGVSASSIPHWFRCATVAQENIKPDIRPMLLSSRDLYLAEARAGEPIGCALYPKAERRGNGRRVKTIRRKHAPDLVAFVGSEIHAFEVELSAKAPARLNGIMKAWKASTWVDEVIYFCAPGAPHKAVQKAVAETEAAGRVKVYEVKGL